MNSPHIRDLLTNPKRIIKRLHEKTFGVRLSPWKLKLLDLAYNRIRIGAFADLGGVWGVDGAYTFYLMSKNKTIKASLVDNHFTDRVKKRAEGTPKLRLIEGDFRKEDTIKQIGSVDLVILFDVLLHQINWKEVLAYCAERTQSFAIYNPQFPGKETIRLLDLGEVGYFKKVPYTKKGLYYEDLFTEREDRDTHGVWQWRICVDLVKNLDHLGFELEYVKNGEAWEGTPFISKAFLF